MEKTNPKTGYKQKKMNLTIYQIDNIMTQKKKLILEHCTSTTHLSEMYPENTTTNNKNCKEVLSFT